MFLPTNSNSFSWTMLKWKSTFINIINTRWVSKITNCVTCAENFILNLSDHELTVPEKLVLSKGLTFIPTARDLTNFEILSDFDTFANKLRKRINPPRINPGTDGFTIYRQNINIKSNTPTKYPQFEGTLQAMKIQLSELQINQSNSRNLSRAQRTALRNLSKNNNIIINKADKGSTIVIRNKTDYITEGQNHLNDSRTYKLLPGDPTNHICKQITTILTDAYKKFYLTKNMYDFCLPPKIVD